MDDNKKNRTEIWYNKERLCFVCGELYTNAKSAGKWQCSEHPGRIENGQFTCCDMKTTFTNKHDFYHERFMSKQYRGCIPCDHHEIPENSAVYQTYATIQRTTEIPLRAANAIGCIAEAREPIPSDPTHVRIWRYDKRAYKAQNERRLRMVLESKEGKYKKQPPINRNVMFYYLILNFAV